VKDWKTTLVAPTDNILKAIKVIDDAALQIALVVDTQSRLLGTVTDGDVRRAILRGVPMDAPVAEIMNGKPRLATTRDDPKDLLDLMHQIQLRQLPLVDDGGQLVGLVTLDGLLRTIQEHDNWVVIMAGGLGTRLRPLTETLPKPLIPVGGKPILETIVENLAIQGFRKLFLSVNYMAEKVRAHFGDGSRWNVEIKYLHETERLGTAGALNLLPERPTSPILVMNADLLTKVNFRALLDFHNEHNATATMSVREYDFQVPYGVVQFDENNRMTGIDEKPVHKFFVNAGIYALSPQALDVLPPQRGYFDMPELFHHLVERDQPTCVFPVRELWIDIGRLEDLQRADAHQRQYFE